MKEKCCSGQATSPTDAIGSNRACSRSASPRPRGDERILTILGPGSIVGELAIIDGGPRSATVVAIRDCKLSFISREAFVTCLREYPEIYSDLVSTLVSRLREADDAMAAASFLTAAFIAVLCIVERPLRGPSARPQAAPAAAE